MLLLACVAPILGTNCYLVASGEGAECVIVDPGIGVDEQVGTVVAAHDLRPVAVLITHGHVDHTFGLSMLCRRYDLPVYLHEDDAYRLADPIGTLGPELAPMLAGFTDDWTAPPDVRALRGGEELTVAGIEVRTLHAPGHTEGSTLYVIPGADEADQCFTGDVLFAGTIGRTDLPGGDDALMRHTRAALADPESPYGLADSTTILPGHGESSTVGHERATNPYLRDVRPR